MWFVGPQSNMGVLVLPRKVKITQKIFFKITDYDQISVSNTKRKYKKPGILGLEPKVHKVSLEHYSSTK